MANTVPAAANILWGCRAGARRGVGPATWPCASRAARRRARRSAPRRPVLPGPPQTEAARPPWRLFVINRMLLSAPLSAAQCITNHHGRRDEACPVSTGGGTRRVQLVREGEGGGSVFRGAAEAPPPRGTGTGGASRPPRGAPPAATGPAHAGGTPPPPPRAPTGGGSQYRASLCVKKIHMII